MKLIKHYREDRELRASFNRLAQLTFGLDFEGWYRNGFWGDSYVPYSILEDGEIVANVSVNRINLQLGERIWRTVQLGTVMTAEPYRNRGYIRRIMEEIDRDTSDMDGVFLFANDSVRQLYPKFGFRTATEYQYEKTVTQEGPCTMEPVLMDGPANWARLRQAMEENRFQTGCTMVENPGLVFFYASQFMQDCVYYEKDLDVWVIAELEAGNLLLHQVFCAAPVTLDQILSAFGREVSHVSLGFTPADPAGFVVSELREDDTTFFVRGELERLFSQHQLRIPTLAHA